MRVISGLKRGAKLFCYESEGLRPTTDRVKENIFNLIQFEIAGKNALDLFAGSGALGIEALSRGAKFCTFVEIDKNASLIIDKNLSKLNLKENSKLYNDSFDKFLNEIKDKFDIVFLDPPYNKGLAKKAIDMLKENNLLSEDAIIVLECEANERFSGLNIVKERTYGRIKVLIIKMD